MEKFRKKSTLVINAVILLTVVVGHVFAESNSLRSSEDDWEPILTLLELELEDVCVNGAEADWAVYNGRVDAFKAKKEADLNYGARSQEPASEVNDIKDDELPELLVRKKHLMKMPGDTMLDLPKWSTLIYFSQSAQNNLKNATNYNCNIDGSQHCTLSELTKTIATSRDRQVLEIAKNSWIKNLPDAEDYLTQVLPLLQDAALRNNFTSVEEYWEALAEYPGAYAKSREIWAEIKSLYQKLHLYVSMKLGANGTSRTDAAVPSHMLGSLLGDDWFNIADVVVPNPGLLAEINRNLKKKRIGGREAYKVASKLLQSIELGDLNERFWRDSLFDKNCPAVFVDFCQPNNVRVGTCSDIGLGNLLDAQEIVMEVKHKEIASEFMANTFLIREANRYSALYEAVPGLASLVALTPQHLDHIGVLPLNIYNSAKNADRNRITLQMLLALRDLPRLNYYLTADAWRLHLLSEGAEQGGKGMGWSLARSEASIVANDRECLGDSYIVSNKPYIGKFLGTLLKYQMLESLTAGPYSDDAKIVQHIASDNQKLKSLLGAGYSKPWPLLMENLLTDSTVSAESLLTYFQPLSEFLDIELADPQTDEDQEDDENVENFGIAYGDETELEEDNEDLKTESEQTEPEETFLDTDDTPKSDLTGRGNNEISADADLRIMEATTFATLENPNLIPKESTENIVGVDRSLHTEKDQENIEQASTPVYVWIGLAAIIAIVVVLAIVIARKRCQHRRELERERREGLKNTPA